MKPADLSLEHTVIFKYITAGKIASRGGPGGDGNSIIVIGHAPEEFDISMGGRWEQTLLGRKAEGLTSRLNEFGSATFGGGLGDPITSVLSYRGNENPAMSVSLEFNAEDDAFQDVVTPIINLAKMTVPSRIQTGLIEYPGPVAYDELKRFYSDFKTNLFGGDSPQTTDTQNLTRDDSGNTDRDGNANQSSPRISVRLGATMYLRSVVIQTLGIKLSSAVDSNRRPIRAVATVGFRRFMAPLREEIEETFMSGGALTDGI